MVIKVTSKQLFEAAQTVLIVAIFGLLLWMQPWAQSSSDATRKVSVTGSATVEAEPDEYTFSPYFEETGTDKEALKKSLTDKANAAVAKIKELGVADKDIKVDASSYEYWYNSEEKGTPMMVYLTISVDDKDMAQKIQDYLLTTTATGQLTPAASFSEEKSKELKKQTIDKATEDARQQAEAQAKLRGAKLGKVIEVSQSDSGAYPILYDAKAAESSTMSSGASLTVMPGENEYSNQVTVTYELK